MVKKTQKAVKKSASPERRSPWSWIILAAGILLLLAGGVMYGMIRSQQGGEDLLKKIPNDAYVAGVVKLADLDQQSVKQLAAATNVYSSQTATILDALSAKDLSAQRLTEAFDSQAAFGMTTHGGLAILRVKDESKAREIMASLSPVLESPTTSDVSGVTTRAGSVKGIPVVVGQDGPNVYVASNAGLIEKARNETNGFPTLDRFNDIAAALPSGRSGYVFYNPKTVRDRVGSDVPLFGLAYSVTEKGLNLALRTGSTVPVNTSLGSTSGKLLPPADAATVSVEGENLLDYLHLLEEQRQETNIPKVLSLQNGISNLGKALGVDFEKEYLAAASGHFSYSRYKTETGIEWMAAAEFPDGPTAVKKVAGLQAALAAKVTIPIRKQVVRVLPDGTQSREVVSEGRQPLGYSNFTVGEKSGSIVALPGSMGLVYFIVHDKYLIASSGANGVSRMLESVTKESDTGSSGELAVRLKLSDVQGVVGEPDTLWDWVLVTRPSKGEFRLDKATGILEGTAGFEHGS